MTASIPVDMTRLWSVAFTVKVPFPAQDYIASSISMAAGLGHVNNILASFLFLDSRFSNVVRIDCLLSHLGLRWRKE